MTDVAAAGIVELVAVVAPYDQQRMAGEPAGFEIGAYPADLGVDQHHRPAVLMPGFVDLAAAGEASVQR